jgi:heavy metal sensor kinase
MPLSIRWKLVLLFIGTVTLILAVFISGDVIGLRKNLMDRVDEDLVEISDKMIRLMDERPDLADHPDQAESSALEIVGNRRAWLLLCQISYGPDEGPCVSFSANGAERPDWKGEKRIRLGADGSFAEWRSARQEIYRIRTRATLARDDPGTLITVGLSAENLLGAWRQALRDHVVLALILIAAVFFIGHFFIRQLLRPIQAIVRTARSITGEDLTQRVDVPETPDEIGDLVRTLNEMIGRLEKSFNQTKRFSADVAHELNTPMAVLRGELEIILRKERTAADYKNALTRMLDEVKRLSEIVDNILFLSSAEETKAVSDEKLSLDRVVLESYEEVLPLAASKGVTFQITGMDECLTGGEAALLKRMFVNLMANAVKFTPAGGSVETELKSAKNGCLLEIRDTGIGIPAEHLPYLFDRFYRADPSRSKSTGGTGLGLSIVKEIARIHRIEIVVQSQVGKGTVIRLKWPINNN